MAEIHEQIPAFTRGELIEDTVFNTVLNLIVKIFYFSGQIRLDFLMENTTAYEGDTLRLSCEITGDPLPEYAWFRHGIPVSTLEQQTLR